MSDVVKCKELVVPAGAWRASACGRKAVKDGFCKQHHPDTVAERRAKSEARYEAKWKRSAAYQLSEALEENKRLRAELQQCRLMLAEFVRDVECYCSENPDGVCPVHEAEYLLKKQKQENKA